MVLGCQTTPIAPVGGSIGNINFDQTFQSMLLTKNKTDERKPNVKESKRNKKKSVFLFLIKAPSVLF